MTGCWTGEERLHFSSVYIAERGGCGLGGGSCGKGRVCIWYRRGFIREVCRGINGSILVRFNCRKTVKLERRYELRQAAYVNECIHCNVLAPRTCKRYSDRYPVAGKLTPYFVSQPSRQCAGPTPGISRNGGVRRSGSNGPGAPTVTKHLKAEAASVAPGRPSHSHPPWAAAPLAVCLAAPLGARAVAQWWRRRRSSAEAQV